MVLLKNINIKSALFFMALSHDVFSKALNGDICGKNYGDATEDIESISKQLDIKLCDAVNVYDYIVKGEKYFEKALQIKMDKTFSEEKCKNKCNKANEKLNNEFKKSDLNLIKVRSKQLLNFDFNTNCLSICHYGALDAEILNEEVSTDDETKEELGNLEKREDKPCDPVSEGKISMTSSKPYNLGFYRYTQDSDSVKTAISVINGCGPKNNEKISKIIGKLEYSDEFEPACNSHDICVTCHQLERSGCDSIFKTNMKTICSLVYEPKPEDNFITKAAKRVKKFDCNSFAELFGSAVSLLGENSYQDTPVNTSPDCAACGVDIIQNTLYHTPFYVLK